MKKSICFLIIFALALAGCASMLKQEQPVRKKFALEVSREASPMEQPLFDGPLLVRDFSVAPTFNTRNLIYRMQEATYESDYYNLFLVEPGQLITQETREWIRAANIFPTVTRPGSGVMQSYTLEGHVLSMYGDFAGDRQRSVFKMQFFLLDESAGSDILFQKEYAQTVSLDRSEPEAVIQGYNEALAAILAQLAEDLRRLR